jgi:hypothetical protein
MWIDVLAEKADFMYSPLPPELTIDLELPQQSYIYKDFKAVAASSTLLTTSN